MKKKRSRLFSKLVKLLHDQTGNALVEATIMVPVVLILFLGVFEFSYVFYQQQLIEIGVRDAARYLSRTSSGNPCLQTTIVTNAANLATTGSINASTPSRVCTNGICWALAPADITCAPSTDLGSYLLPDGTFGTPLIITVSTTGFVDPSLGFFGVLGFAPPTIPFTHSERYLGG